MTHFVWLSKSHLGKEPYNNANQRELESPVFIEVGWGYEGIKATKFRR